jgi:hypothetical protein
MAEKPTEEEILNFIKRWLDKMLRGAEARQIIAEARRRGLVIGGYSRGVGLQVFGGTPQPGEQALIRRLHSHQAEVCAILSAESVKEAQRAMEIRRLPVKLRSARAREKTAKILRETALEVKPWDS